MKYESYLFCRKFSAAKHCLRDLITNNCSGNSRHPSFEIALVFDEYNPFCPGSKDLADGNYLLLRPVPNAQSSLGQRGKKRWEEGRGKVDTVKGEGL